MMDVFVKLVNTSILPPLFVKFVTMLVLLVPLIIPVPPVPTQTPETLNLLFVNV
jgi:hypothetical protein